MLTGIIPLEYDRVGKTGLTAGLIDSLIYAGSALAGAVGGGLYEHMGSGALYASWIAAAVFSALLMRISALLSTRYWKAADKPAP
jgi:predicted MFS family arabinose efflux permease